MTSIPVIRRAFLLLALAPFLLSPAGLAQEDPAAQFSVVLGGQSVNDVDEHGRARFNERREVDEGAVLEDLRILLAPKGSAFRFAFAAKDVSQDDQRYALEATLPGRVTFKARYVESPRTIATASRTLWAGAGGGRLTLDEGFRLGAETAAGAPTAPFASEALKAYMTAALGGTGTFTIGSKRKDLGGDLSFVIVPSLTLAVSGAQELRSGTKALGFGTYIRRQALAGTPGTGANSFWRETIEARGSELIEPIDYRTLELSGTLVWAANGHSASGGFSTSRFRNDITALYFDNPFEAGPGRASATGFDPRADQEPGSPIGNNNLRGLHARSSVQLWPNNDYDRVFGNVSVKLGDKTRLNVDVSRAGLTQNDPFLPYAENDQVVFSGTPGQPGVVYAKDAVLPRPSLDGKMVTKQADVRIASRPIDGLSVRAGYRIYDLDDDRPQLIFPGYSSSGDSFFRAGIGQKDAAGNRILYNVVGGYTRKRLSAGAGYRLGAVVLDAEYARTGWDYEARQVESTVENAFKGSVRATFGEAVVGARYQRAQRDYRGAYTVGLETSGVRAYDVWARNRDEAGLDVEIPASESIVLGLGGTYVKDSYPGAVAGFTYGYGLQDDSSADLFANATYAHEGLSVSAFAGYSRSEWNSLQVTKSSLTTDYNPINRYTRETQDKVVWVGFEAIVPITKKARVRADLTYQRLVGDYTATNLGTPDINSAVAYEIPKLRERLLTARGSFIWDLTGQIGLEMRYWYEPYRLNDFAIDQMQPYMQGVLKETRSSPADVGDANVSRFLFLDSRYGSYTAHVLSALVRLAF